MKSALVALLPVIAVALSSCSPGSSVAGSYTLDREAITKAMESAAGEAENAPPGMAEMMKKMIEDMEFNLDIVADGTFKASMKMSVLGQVKTDEATGTWKLDGDKLTMTNDAKDGKPSETKTATFKDGQIILKEGGAGGKEMELVFKRK